MAKTSRFYVDLMAVHPEVTGSSLLGIVSYPDGSKERFIVDCGLFQEKEYMKYNNTFSWNPENIDAAFLTHIHVDHSGRFPLLVKKGYAKRIYMTCDSKTLLPYALYDSEKVLGQISKRNYEKPLYTQSDVVKTISQMYACNFEETVQVAPNIKATFFSNAHLVGAAIILIQISCERRKSIDSVYGDINLLFTGDYNSKNIFFDVSGLPKWVLDLPLTIIQEATYGNMLKQDVTECFEENMLNPQFKTRVVPVFSLGRAQEILYKLKCMQFEKKLSTDIPIYFDGKLSFKYTEKFYKGKISIRPSMLSFLPENITYVSDETRKFILSDRNPKIIVTSSGMGSHGPAHIYIPEYLKQKNALIHFTGYTAEGTLGRGLKDAKQGDILQVSGLMVPKNATVEYTTEYSAHAKADEMIDFLKQFSNIRLVLINHGSEQAKKSFAQKVLNQTEAREVGILDRDYFFRVGPYGLVKTMATKFD